MTASDPNTASASAVRGQVGDPAGELRDLLAAVVALDAALPAATGGDAQARSETLGGIAGVLIAVLADGCSPADAAEVLRWKLHRLRAKPDPAEAAATVRDGAGPGAAGIRPDTPPLPAHPARTRRHQALPPELGGQKRKRPMQEVPVSQPSTTSGNPAAELARHARLLDALAAELAKLAPNLQFAVGTQPDGEPFVNVYQPTKTDAEDTVWVDLEVSVQPRFVWGPDFDWSADASADRRAAFWAAQKVLRTYGRPCPTESGSSDPPNRNQRAIRKGAAS